MRFTEYKGKIRKKTNLVKFVEEFHASGIKVAKVEEWEYCSTQSAVGNINRCVKRLGILTVKASARNGEVFLIRTDV